MSNKEKALLMLNNPECKLGLYKILWKSEIFWRIKGFKTLEECEYFVRYQIEPKTAETIIYILAFNVEHGESLIREILFHI